MAFWTSGTGPSDARRAAGDEQPANPGEMSGEELLDAVAKRIVQMRLAVPAVFFLESSKPLSFVGSQVLVFLQPFVEAFLTVRNYQRFAHLMEDRKNVELLIRRIEDRDEDARAEEKRAKQEARRRKREEKRRPRPEEKA